MPDLETRVKREVLRAAVARQITCPITGEVLDVRTAVMVENSAGTATLGVVSATAWEEIGAAVLRADANVIVTKGSDL